MSKTKISWSEYVCNPFPGCRKISPGCQNCYAERMAMRLKAMGQAAYQDVVDANGWTGKVGCNPETMKVPGKDKRVFCQSMGDLFYEGITDEQILWAYDQIRTLGLSGHIVKVLTKRPERAADLLPRIEFDGNGECRMWYGKTWPVPFVALLRNHWLGVTAENQDWADKRIPILFQIPAAVRFVSFEPLLGPIEPSFGENLEPDEDSAVGWGRCDVGGVPHQHFLGDRCDRRIDWVIVGCESGPNRRPCDNRWISDIAHQCHAARVPIFVKQINIGGEVVHDSELIVAELEDFYGRPLLAEEIRQWPQRKTLQP